MSSNQWLTKEFSCWQCLVQPVDHHVLDDVAVDPHLIVLAMEVAELRAALLVAEDAHSDLIASTHPKHRRSAANLIHYVELRKHDLRKLQTELSVLGLSSLGRCEASVLATIEAVLGVLSKLACSDPSPVTASVSLGQGDELLQHADMISLSFVRHPADVELLQNELKRLDATEIGIVLKIENVMAFENLPELLLAAMRSEHLGVMIARGDLAVEVGFERLAEVQEEIMWACEAAHVPVIWATQVLDTLARTGQASRAEVTDAAMADRAECVMLNKGPNITKAIQTLDSILRRMQDHQDKKRSLLRRLRSWDRE